jgi:hypothetical protein
MWHWLKQRFGGGAKTARGIQIIGQESFTTSTMRNGKSIISDTMTATDAEDGDTVAVDRDGQLRIIGRAPRVVVDNTK